MLQLTTRTTELMQKDLSKILVMSNVLEKFLSSECGVDFLGKEVAVGYTIHDVLLLLKRLCVENHRILRVHNVQNVFESLG